MEKLDEAIEKSKPSKEIVADKKTETKDGNV